MLPLNYFLYLQLILFMFITPGTPRIVIVSHTMNYGIKNSVWTALGDISANFVQMVLIVFVIGSLLEDNPEIFVYFKWAGILYVLYLAYETFTAKIKTIRSVGKVSKSIFSFLYLAEKCVRINVPTLAVFANSAASFAVE